MVRSRFPRVSVIVHARGGEDVAASLRSVLEQTFPDFEVLVAFPGNGQPADLDEIARLDPRIQTVISPDTDLPARLRNRALRRARGLLVAFLESGDRWHPEKLARQVAFMRAHPDFAFTFTGTDGPGEQVLAPALPGRILDGLLRGSFIATSAVMVRSSALRLVGRFDESSRLRGYDDYELLLRLALREQAGSAVEERLAWLAPRERTVEQERLRECLKRRSILRRLERVRSGARHEKLVRDSLAATLTAIGRRCLHERRIRRSRRFLHDSIRTCPVQLRGYMLLGLSYVTPRAMRRPQPGR